MSPGLRSQLGYVIRASSVIVRDPSAGVERFKGRLSRREDERAFLADGRSIDEIYPIDVEWLFHLHQELECELPCFCQSEAEALYSGIMEMFRSKGLPEKYADWCDGGRGFTTAAWCLTRHLEPQTVVDGVRG